MVTQWAVRFYKWYQSLLSAISFRCWIMNCGIWQCKPIGYCKLIVSQGLDLVNQLVIGNPIISFFFSSWEDEDPSNQLNTDNISSMIYGKPEHKGYLKILGGDCERQEHWELKNSVMISYKINVQFPFNLDFESLLSLGKHSSVVWKSLLSVNQFLQ